LVKAKVEADRALKHYRVSDYQSLKQLGEIFDNDNDSLPMKQRDPVVRGLFENLQRDLKADGEAEQCL